VQGEAAILAIIISVTIFAVSTSQSYSPRIVDIFLDKDRVPHFWSLLAIYIFALIHGIFILKFIKTENSYVLSNLQTSIWIACSLGVIAFLSLIKYIPNILTTLKPSSIIEALANEIEIGSILYKSTESESVRLLIAPDTSLPKNSPIGPIIDIVNSSIVNNNNEIAIHGLGSIEKQMIRIVKEQTLDDEQYKGISQTFRDKFATIGFFCIEQNNHEVIAQITRTMVSFELSIFEIIHDFENMQDCIILLENLASTAIEQDKELVLSQILKSMVIMGTNLSTLESNIKSLERLIESFKKITMYAIDNNKDMFGAKCAQAIMAFGVDVFSLMYIDVFAEKLRETLESLGMYATRLEKKSTSFKVVLSLLRIRQNFNNLNSELFITYDQSVNKIIDNAISNGQYPLVIHIVEHLSDYPTTTVQRDAKQTGSGSYLIDGNPYNLEDFD
jgi:hypothetical protein